MKTKMKMLAMVALAAIASSTGLNAQTVGYVTRTVAAGSIATPTATAFSLTLSRSPESTFVGPTAGALTGVGTNTLTDSTATWATNFTTTTAAQPYVVRITSGTGAGRTYRISASTSTQLTVVNNGFTLSSDINVGDTYEILLGETLATMFNVADVLGATSSANADNVSLFNGTSWSTFYYNSTAGQWRSGALPTNRSNEYISPESGFIYTRRGGTPMTILSTGLVPYGAFQTEVSNTTASFLGGIYPTDTTLGALNIQATPGWVSTTAAATSDKVAIFNGTSWTQFYYNSTASQWRSGVLPTNRSGEVVLAGTPVLLFRVSPSAGTATLTRNVPY